MAVYVLKWAEVQGTGSVAYPDCAGDIISNRYEADLSQSPLKGVTLAVGDIIEFGLIPANATVTDVTIDSDKLDSGGTALAFDVGVLTGTQGATTGRTCGQEFYAASGVAGSGGVARMTRKEGFRVAPVQSDTSIGIKITTAATTLATTGKLALNVEAKG